MYLRKFFKNNIDAIILFIILNFLAGCINTHTDTIVFRASGKNSGVPSWQHQISLDNFSDISSNSNGSVVWAVGYRLVFHLSSGEWKRDTLLEKLFKNQDIRSVSQSSNSDNAWIIGDSSIARFKSGQGWKVDSQCVHLLNGKFISSISSMSDGSEAWGIEDKLILHYTSDSGWKICSLNFILDSAEKLTKITMSGNGEEGWIIGEKSIYRFKKNQGWFKDSQINLKNNWLNSISISEDGSKSWAAIGRGIAEFNEKSGWQWMKMTEYEGYKSVTINANGTEGWALGQDDDYFQYVFHYTQATGWVKLNIPDNELGLVVPSQIIVSGNGEKAWITGLGHILTHDKKSGWKANYSEQQSRADFINAVSCVASGNEAWAVGHGVILHYRKTKGWTRDEIGSKTASGVTLYSVSISSDGREGWATGEKLILHYSVDRGWSIDTKGTNLIKNYSLRAIRVSGNGREIWAVGDGIIIHKSLNMEWELNKKATVLYDHKVTYNCVAVNEDGNEILIPSDDSVITHTKENGWQITKVDTLEDYDKFLPATSACISGDGTVGFIAGTNMLFKYDKKFGFINDFTNVPFPNELRTGIIKESENKNLADIAISKDGNEAWASAGDYLLYYTKANGWRVSYTIADMSQNLNLKNVSICLSSNGNNGWQSWEKDGIYDLSKIKKTASFSLDEKSSKNLMSLRDSVILNFRDSAYGLELQLGSENDNSNYLNISSNLYSTKLVNDTLVIIYFSNSAKKVLETLKDKFATFRIYIKTDPNYDSKQEFTSNEFLIGNLPKWIIIGYSALEAGFLFLLANIMFLLLAIKFPWFREKIFGNDFLSLMGLFSFKGVFTKPLLKWIRPLKLALLSDYRNELRTAPYLQQWTNHTKIYNPPQIGETIEADSVTSLWKKIDLEHRYVSNSIWFIEGRSGLGKSALIEQLTLKALRFGKTPVLVRLNSFVSNGVTVQQIFESYGRLIVDAETAEDMIKEGGFCMLLDGLNESKNPEDIRLFINSCYRKNIIIISSQFAPEWPEIQMKKIELKHFGRQQLTFLLPNEQKLVNQISSATYLFDVTVFHEFSKDSNFENGAVGILPFTATLIIEYAKKHGNQLPPNRLAIYQELFKEIQHDNLFLNLERKAWDMFCQNSQNIFSNDLAYSLDEPFLQKAKANQILTQFAITSQLSYRFRHDRIFRFVVASYLFKQESTQELEKLHAKLGMGQDKLYWADVIEFWGEFLAEKASQSTFQLTKYKEFILSVGQFELLILKKRLIFQWERLCNKTPSIRDVDFDSRLLLMLTLEGKDI
jgi:hypothetical protein